MKHILPLGEHNGVEMTISQNLSDMFTLIHELLETSVRFSIIVLTLIQFIQKAKRYQKAI